MVFDGKNYIIYWNLSDAIWYFLFLLISSTNEVKNIEEKIKNTF